MKIHDKANLVLMCIYVDDFLIIGRNIEEIE